MSPSRDALEDMVSSEREGTRTWTVWGSSREELLERVTLIFAEHVHDDDEVHVAYNAMPCGWEEQPACPEDGSRFTELLFEYSALVVIRRGLRQGRRELVDAIWALVDKLDRE